MRSQLRYVVQDQAGNVRSGRSIEVFDYGTTTPISNPMYPSATSVVVLNPNTLATNTLGEVEVWIDGARAPVDIRIGGASGTTETVYFMPDPSTLGVLTTPGDLAVGGASGVAGRLGIGTAFQELAVNAGATALQWASGVLARAVTAGDIFQATGANAIARLGIGTARQNLAVNPGATALEYVASLQSLMTTAGDILFATLANTPARLGIGTARQNLSVNSTATALEYVASIQSIIQAAGDIIQGSGANAGARLAIGTARQNLQVNAVATALAYADSLQSLIQAAGDLIQGSGANTPARLPMGANGTYLGVVAGALAWTAGSNAPLTTAEADLGATVNLNVVGTYFDGPSISLAAGTWFITGAIMVGTPTATSQIQAKLWDGTTVESSAETLTTGPNAYIMLPLFGIVSPGSTTTYKISARAPGDTAAVMRAVAFTTMGNNVSHIRAIKVA